MPQTKRALLIGIDKYEHINQLNGCVNDAKLMEGILRDGFGFEKITVLLNEQATRTAILSAFAEFAKDTNDGDVAVFYYAGHGSQMRDREGDEPSGWDSTLMPVDTWGGKDWNEKNLDITDDEIHLWLMELAKKTTNITVIVDACHSGTITRDGDEPEGTATRGFPPDTRPVEQLGESPIPKEMWPLLKGTASARGESAWLPIDDKYVLIAGCRDSETSKEFGIPLDNGITEKHGALTWSLSRELLRTTPKTTYRDLFERTAAKVSSYFPTQHPQIEGMTDRVLFGLTEIPPMKFVRVESRNDKAVVLSNGAAHGVVVGSRYDVYPPGTTNTAEATSLGEIEVTSVRATTSDARVVDPARAGAIEPLSRAILTKQGKADVRLAVRIVAEAGANDASDLAAAIDRSMLVRVAGEGDAAELTAKLEGEKWFVIGPDARIAKPVKASNEAADVLFNLEAYARHRLVLDLVNPDPASVMSKGRISMEVMRQSSSGGWERATNDGGGLAVFNHGDNVALEITNGTDKPMYFAMIDLGLTGRVIPLYPPRGTLETPPLPPGATFKLWQETPKRFTVPNAFPFIDSEAGPARWEGVETLKLIATSSPTNFEFLRQEVAQRGDSDSAAGLQLLLQTAMGAMRDGDEDPPLPPGEDWTTVSRAFVMRKRDPIGSDALREAMSSCRVLAKESIVIAGDDAGARAGSEGSHDLDVAAAPEGYANVVMKVDDTGYTSWHFPSDSVASRSGSATDRFSIPLAPATPAVDDRAISTITMLTITLTVLQIPIVKAGITAVVENRAAAWEKTHRPYRVRSLTAENYASVDAPPFDDAAWTAISGKRSLLLLHGPLGRSHTSFSDLPADVMAKLSKAYEGRVFGFDHYTLGHDAFRNAQEFIRAVPDGTALDVDIIAFSRGGLVARTLVEKQSELSLDARTLKIGKVVFVGTPNAGTPLAESGQAAGFLNQTTSLVKAIMTGSGKKVELFEGVIQIVSSMATDFVTGITGINTMSPESAFLKGLNSTGKAGDTKYFAISSDYSTADSGLKALVAAKSMSAVIGAPNDCIVPADSAWAANGSAMFPVENHKVLKGLESSSHFEYFANPRVHKHLLDWLEVSA